jgi:hypothetical protein
MIFTVTGPETAAADAAADAADPPRVELVDDPFRPEPSPRAARRSDDDDDRDRRPRRDRDDDAPRRAVARKSQSSGSALPWVLGIIGLAIVVSVSCGGGTILIVSLALREREPHRDPVAVKKDGPMGPVQPPPPVGAPLLRPQATRVQLVNGLFTTTSSLTLQDPQDPFALGCRCKVYQIDLQAGRSYTIDMTTPNNVALEPHVRVENLNGFNLAEHDHAAGNVSARVVFTPTQSASFLVYATTFRDGQFGQFTLTIREGVKVGN